MATPHEPRPASRHQAGDQIAFHSSAFTVRLAHSGYSLKVAVPFSGYSFDGVVNQGG